MERRQDGDPAAKIATSRTITLRQRLRAIDLVGDAGRIGRWQARFGRFTST